MTATGIIERAAQDGVTVALTAAGTIRATGDSEAMKQWHATLREHKPAILAALVNAAARPHRVWRIRYLGAGSMDVIFAPEATPAEVVEIYPGANVEPILDARRNATPSEAAELCELIKVALADADDTDRAEALTVALGDPEAALVSFRAYKTV